MRFGAFGNLLPSEIFGQANLPLLAKATIRKVFAHLFKDGRMLRCLKQAYRGGVRLVPNCP
ncbi:MAG: hypothetical protein UT86_C0002G0067 [Candidatus Magasanikbacteria bacterium GW2011_GWC2_40_17]|uniref:Uncharacterized protein n=1 Tax=Candidatus Magasanikbacteria bacterium GW2011_GWA2_42_32 TaxID=1619039 RepID=A0A0G1D5C5_9BACT|nr:MAG: hypothetical protein UT86_C0002G0067 [Candidatus Magasanikbacteria bacterium GW2011_GWC2_40_17]KKS57228.1 MAG: hypothetical protein UV20_C0002G0017 [Candidatus Magasanikbacteria bacterium GW2011_GWA2_42_32]